MIITNLLELSERAQLRKWYEKNIIDSNYFWLVVTIKPKNGVVQYLDAVEEAICFGWIDGIKKKTDDGRLAQRFSPRKKNSNWTELNKSRARRLIKLGLMTEHGKRNLPDLSMEAFEIDDVILKSLKESNAYESFMRFPELYRRIRIDTIQSVREDEVLFNKRVNKLVDQTLQGRMYGQWNDGGRLLEFNS